MAIKKSNTKNNGNLKPKHVKSQKDWDKLDKFIRKNNLNIEEFND